MGTKMANSILLLPILAYCLSLTRAEYPTNFHNQTGCLYSFIEKGTYQITFPEAESEIGELKNLEYDSKTNCTNGVFPGNLIMNFQVSDNNMESMTIELEIKPYPNEGYWEVNKATLKFEARNKEIFKTNTVELAPVDMYAGQSFSYSCNSLVLQSLVPKKGNPHFKLILNRFQLQPFAELPRMVFAPSYDCSTWISLPVLMGFILILFITFTVMLGVYLLMEQGNQSSDLRFSKQGGMLMNQQQLDAIKG